MGAAGEQLDLEQREAVPLLQHPVMGGDGPRTRFGFFQDIDPVLLLVFFEVSLKRRLPRLRQAMDDAQIILVDFPVPQLVVEDPQGLRVFSRDDDPAGVSVDAVDQRRSERLLPFRICLLYTSRCV